MSDALRQRRRGHHRYIISDNGCRFLLACFGGGVFCLLILLDMRTAVKITNGQATKVLFLLIYWTQVYNLESFLQHETVFNILFTREVFKRDAFWWHPPSFISSDFGHVTPPLSCACHVTVRGCCRRSSICSFFLTRVLYVPWTLL